jgi:hypothetical protein
MQSNQTMKPTPKVFASRLAPLRGNLSVFATDPRPWLISFSLGGLKWRHRQCCELWHSTTGRHDGKN